MSETEPMLSLTLPAIIGCQGSENVITLPSVVNTMGSSWTVWAV